MPELGSPFSFLSLHSDYKDNPELDRYDSDVDDRDYADLDPRKRAEAEAALRKRDIVEGRLPQFMKDGMASCLFVCLFVFYLAFFSFFFLSGILNSIGRFRGG